MTTHPDIFGGETEIIKPAHSSFQDFRQRNRYRDGTKAERCRSCRHFAYTSSHTKAFRKFRLMGISRSAASDIRAGGVCDLWER